jgi:Zn finger protein HypA/HybF involved in hydrogenase expression
LTNAYSLGYTEYAMAFKIIKVYELRCARCQHKWQPRIEIHKIRICPKCKSPYWDVPRPKTPVKVS